ncbi:ClpX C4-type zinc finger protein [Hyalangium sp.]|uniref:ClpX C4-type zinc finger protein n=1 Tax=Hyalangium sp. TaxID=2028555 RepID=UPI002D5B9187|nr:ClpX C4-type zinc finger protein [Hyalangium sp.]HYH95686.1 ClpX C4-type zinc finger protein [Hyalangium sp.]
MSSPRDHIRAAQAAELRGDKPNAVAELRKAAELYRRAGNSARALQVLRHARSLDPSREDVAEELRRLERLPDTESSPEAGVPVELQEASRRAFDWALRHAQEEEGALRAWPLQETEPQAGETPEGRLPVKPRRADVVLEMKAIVDKGVTALVADVGDGSAAPASEEALPVPMVSPDEFRSYQEQVARSDEEAESPERGAPAAKERALIERGPTRADPALDAWCSFCCLPRVEVGELVAGPTGSFICAACVGESGGLLGLEGPAATHPRPVRRKDVHAEMAELVGQQDARALLERALKAGARRVLVIGPEGTGKTVWFRELASQERGTIMTLEALEQGAGGPVVLVEDVDRLPLEAQERLGSFLARHPERTVLMSARGTLGAPKLVLQGAEGRLPILGTHALSEGVLGAVPVSLLEQIQLAIALQVPTRDELMEVARRLLVPRASELSVTEEVLAAIAAEAASSPRAGHELNALLARVLVGSWSLMAAGPKPGAKKGKAPRAAAKPARRRRKGTV